MRSASRSLRARVTGGETCPRAHPARLAGVLSLIGRQALLGAPAPVWSCNQVRTFDHQPVRQIVRLEVGGRALRVRLTDPLGAPRIARGAVRIAVSSPNGVTMRRDGGWCI